MNGQATPGHAVDVDAARRFFARSARSTTDHDGSDVLAREVERRMLERLDYVRLAPDRILDAGAGHGRGLRMLAQRYPQAQPVGVDWAHPLLTQGLARRSLLLRAQDLFNRRRPWPVCADFSALPFAHASFQLIWSNLALSWAKDPLEVFREWCRVLEVGGLVMFSAYGPDTLKELRKAFAATDALPHTLRFIDMHDLGDMLSMAGFSEPVMDMETITLTYADFDSMVTDLRLTGQANAAHGRRRGLLGRRAYQAVRDAYEAMRSQGRLPVTVEIVYGHAWRGEARMTAEGHSIIRTDFKRGSLIRKA